MRTDVMKKQIGGEHYNKHMGMQTWDIVDEYDLNYYEGNALKYILRSKSNRKEDLQKAIHYLEKEIENLVDKPNEKEFIEKIVEHIDVGKEIARILEGSILVYKGINSEGQYIVQDPRINSLGYKYFDRLIDMEDWVKKQWDAEGES